MVWIGQESYATEFDRTSRSTASARGRRTAARPRRRGRGRRSRPFRDQAPRSARESSVPVRGSTGRSRRSSASCRSRPCPGRSPGAPPLWGRPPSRTGRSSSGCRGGRSRDRPRPRRGRRPRGRDRPRRLGPLLCVRPLRRKSPHQYTRSSGSQNPGIVLWRPGAISDHPVATADLRPVGGADRYEAYPYRVETESTGPTPVGRRRSSSGGRTDGRGTPATSGYHGISVDDPVDSVRLPSRPRGELLLPDFESE